MCNSLIRPFTLFDFTALPLSLSFFCLSCVLTATECYLRTTRRNMLRATLTVRRRLQEEKKADRFATSVLVCCCCTACVSVSALVWVYKNVFF